MASLPSKNEKCLYCSMSESMSEDIDWVQCGKCKHWAHFSCAGVNQGIVNSEWCCPQCFPSSGQQLKVPDATKKRSKKSGHRSDGGSDLGAGSDLDPTEKQLEEEQLAKERAFAKQMAVRKSLLARQKTWKDEQLKQEREMREQELQVNREAEEQQLQQEQEMLDTQLAAEKVFLEKRDAIRKKFDCSVKRVNAYEEPDGAVAVKLKDRKVEGWLPQSTKTTKQPLTTGFRGAFPKGIKSLEAIRSRNTSKAKAMQPVKKVPEIVDTESDSSEEEESSDASEDPAKGSRYGSRVGDGPGRSARSSELGSGSERPVGRITREQLAARKAVSQHLPTFRGEPEVWPLFISSFEHTTTACGFSNLENLKRLQDCLQGDALEAVRSRLILPDSVPDVISDLRNLFGRPEKLLKMLLAKVRNAPIPRADRLETFIPFGITVKQLCDHLDATGLKDHLNNPMLVQELVDKLPPSYKLDWVRYKRDKVDSPLRMFTCFITAIVSDVSEVTEFSSFSMNERRCVRENCRKEYVQVHDADERPNERTFEGTPSRICWICGEMDHTVRNCEEFRRMNIEERLQEVELQGLCEVCLNMHRKGPCLSKTKCTVRDCRGNHHYLLHRVEESVQLQKVKSDCNVIFRMMPVTLYVGERQYDTVAFLDEGSSTTLVDDAIARRLNAEGTREPLKVTWTGNINRFEKESRSVGMMMSATGSNEKFRLTNTRTVTELQLPKQNIRYTELKKRYSHLADVPVKDCPSGLPTIIIGLDNLHLFAPLESRVGKPNEPIAVRSKIGWTIYGSEKRKAGVQTYLNFHSVAPISKKQHYVRDETACRSFVVPESTKELRIPSVTASDGSSSMQQQYEKAGRGLLKIAQSKKAEYFTGEIEVLNKDRPANQRMSIEKFGDNKEVRVAAQGIRDDCADKLKNERTKWMFNPPVTPHMLGVQERMVRSVKEKLFTVHHEGVSQKFASETWERWIRDMIREQVLSLNDEVRPSLVGDLINEVKGGNREYWFRRLVKKVNVSSDRIISQARVHGSTGSSMVTLSRTLPPGQSYGPGNVLATLLHLMSCEKCAFTDSDK